MQSMCPFIVAWVCFLFARLWVSYYMDGMNEFHWANVEIHLIFFENILCAPPFERKFPCIPLGILSNLGSIRPYQPLDSVWIMLMRWNRHCFDDRIELDPGIGPRHRLFAAVVLQRYVLCSRGENVLLIAYSATHIRFWWMVDTKTPYQPTADLIVALRSHAGGRIYGISVRWDHFDSGLGGRVCEYLFLGRCEIYKITTGIKVAWSIL